jgi:hypothetical protein
MFRLQNIDNGKISARSVEICISEDGLNPRFPAIVGISQDKKDIIEFRRREQTIK